MPRISAQFALLTLHLEVSRVYINKLKLVYAIADMNDNDLFSNVNSQ